MKGGCMNMQFEELDEVTRKYMLREFEAEQLQKPYIGERLSQSGRRAFPDLMRAAIKDGSETTVISALLHPQFWEAEEPYTRNGVTRMRRVNFQQAAEQLGLHEFSSWYVRGFAA